MRSNCYFLVLKNLEACKIKKVCVSLFRFILQVSIAPISFPRSSFAIRPQRPRSSIPQIRMKRGMTDLRLEEGILHARKELAFPPPSFFPHPRPIVEKNRQGGGGFFSAPISWLLPRHHNRDTVERGGRKRHFSGGRALSASSEARFHVTNDVFCLPLQVYFREGYIWRWIGVTI